MNNNTRCRRRAANQSVPGWSVEAQLGTDAAAWLLLAGTVGAWATPTAHTRRHGRIQKIQKKSGADAPNSEALMRLQSTVVSQYAAIYIQYYLLHTVRFTSQIYDYTNTL